MSANHDEEDTLQSFHEGEKTTDRPLIRVMALHALAYCERLFYLEEVEEIRVADANVYAGRRLHDGLDKGPDIYSLELASDRLGIRGQVDCVKRQSGELIVFEHKKGKSCKGEAWPSDRLQTLAYTLLLAEHTGENLSEARIRYHADNKTIRLAVELEKAESEIRAAVQRAEELRAALERPPVTAPEEERFAGLEKDKAGRLFPADDDRRVIHVTEQGASLSKDGDQIVVWLPDGSKKQLPGLMVGALVLHGNIQISTQCIHFCAAHDIGVHWLSYGGYYVGALSPGAGGVQRRVRQFEALRDISLRNRLCCRLVQAKAENQLRYLLRATRDRDKELRDQEVKDGLELLRSLISQLARLAEELNAAPAEGALSQAELLRGYEGKAGTVYFSLLPKILRAKPDDFLHFSGRNRRPPKDPFNALLSFGYSLLYRDCMNSLLAVGLDPCLGFMHTPRSAAYPLALDLMDLFRLILWDMPLIGSVNRGQWSQDDFVVTGRQVWLNRDGRRKAVSLYENRKQEKWKHPVLEYSLSYARTIELEARLLEKEWTGKAGLFAALRLR